MQVFIFALLVAVATAASVPYPKPAYSSEKQSYSNNYDPIPYSFEWAVQDEYYNDFAHQESSDGKGYVTGSYRVLLPDGRTQIVNYKADDYTGYVADVKYEGVAKYPEYSAQAYRADSQSYKSAAKY